MNKTIIELTDTAGSRLSIVVLRRPYAESKDFDDAEWLSCEIEAQASGFGGRVSGTLTLTELELIRNLLTDLRQHERESAQFYATEAFLELEITRNSRASFDAHVALTKHGETEMRFEFNMLV